MRVYRPSLVIVLLICAVVAGLLFVGVVILQHTSAENARAADAAKQAAIVEAGTVDHLCATDPDVAARIPGDCARARVVREEVPTEVGVRQVDIEAAVRNYLAEHPPPAGRSATPSDVAAAVAAYLVANPVQPGRAPTPQEIADAAAAYIATHPDDFRGQPGQNATDGQVSEAVAAFCAAHGQCRGPAGEDGRDGTNGQNGAPGSSVVDLVFERVDGACTVVITFDNPSRVERHPAGDAACPVATPAPSPTTAARRR